MHPASQWGPDRTDPPSWPLPWAGCLLGVYQPSVDQLPWEQLLRGLFVRFELDRMLGSPASGLEFENRHPTVRGTHKAVDGPAQYSLLTKRGKRNLVEN